MKEVDRIWNQAFAYLPKELKDQTRQNWKGALVYITSTNLLRKTILPHLTLFLVGVDTDPGVIAVAIAPLAEFRARSILGEPLGYL